MPRLRKDFQVKILVVILNSLRSFALSAPSLVEKLVRPLGADVAYIGSASQDPRDSLSLLGDACRTVWTDIIPEDTAWERCLDINEDDQGWQRLLRFPGPWLGGVTLRSGRVPGSGAIQLAIRGRLLDRLRSRHYEDSKCELDQYDRFVLTRSDFVYLSKFTPGMFMDPGIYFPDGEFHGGYTDRFAVADRAGLEHLLSLTETLIAQPGKIASRLEAQYGEKTLAYHMNPERLLGMWVGGYVRHHIPYTMYTVKRPEDPTSWSAGELVPELGYCVKYPEEHKLARRASGAASG